MALSGYLAWHKSPRVPLSKLPLYLLGAAASGGSASEIAATVALTFAVIELGGGVARRQLNDVADYALDRKRADRWRPRFDRSHRPLVRLAIAARLLAAAGLAVLAGRPLLCLPLAGLVLAQVGYDNRGSSGKTGVALAACGYSLRVLSCAFASPSNGIAWRPLALAAVFAALAGGAQVLQWRHAESRFLVGRGAPLKVDSRSFRGRDRSVEIFLLGIPAAVLAVLTSPAAGTTAALGLAAAAAATLAPWPRASPWRSPLSRSASTVTLAIAARTLLSPPVGAVLALAGLCLLAKSWRAGPEDSSYFEASGDSADPADQDLAREVPGPGP